MGFLSSLKELFGGANVDYIELMVNGALVVDVRSSQEFKGGYFKGSKNIPLPVLTNITKALNGKVVILVCKSGGRAGSAEGILTRAGVEVYNAGAWQNLT
jgi:phage shock protein E|tara:strand:- start:318 stop:617 length:300 start_codon:yes stop_codon:yes gene_type:complete